MFYRRGWEPADGVDKPDNFSSIAGSFNIATAGSYLKDRKMDVKGFKSSISTELIQMIPASLWKAHAEM